MTSSADVAAALSQVHVPEVGGYDVARISGAPSFRVGRGGDGSIVLLTPPEEDGSVGAPTRLRRLTVHSRTTIAVGEAGRVPSSETVGFVELRELSDDLVPAFCGIAATVANLIGNAPAPGTVRAALRHVVRLFEPRPGRGGSVLGIWGEVLAILAARDTEEMVEAWHAAVDDRFDFAAPGRRVEVKTTETGKRLHEFNLEQLRPLESADTRVVSIVTTATSSGASLGDLIEELQASLASRVDLSMKVWQLVAETLGADWLPATSSMRWDRLQATQSARVFRGADIPSITEALNPAVESVRLRVVCEHVTTIEEPISIGF